MKFCETVNRYYSNIQTQSYYQKFWSQDYIHIGFFNFANETLAKASFQATQTLEKSIPSLKKDSTQLLDLGAGFGGDAMYLASLGYSVTGIDGCKANLEVCRSNDRKKSIEWVHGYFEKLPFPDEQFDIIWAHETMVHVENKSYVFSEIQRVLKPGGIFLFTDILVGNSVDELERKQIESRIPIKAFSAKQYNFLIDQFNFKLKEHKMASEHIKRHYEKLSEELSAFEDFDKVLTREWKKTALAGLSQWNLYIEREWIAYGYWVLCKASQKAI